MSVPTTQNWRAERRQLDQERERLARALQDCWRRRAELEQAYPWARRVGDRVREARTHRGLSQEMLARVAGLHPSTISRIERGANRHGMNGQTVAPLCQALGITADHLLLEA
jgi:ribosome-binding protein aMBF1 (putative translation factor)